MKLVKFLQEKGWVILIGCCKEAENGEYTFTGKQGNSVIYYVITVASSVEEVESMTVEDNIDSDHHPLVVEMRGEINKQKRKKENSGKRKRGDWSQAGRERFRREIQWTETGRASVQGEME